MTYNEVVSEICTRVNDPDKDTYEDRAKELFFDGISTILRGGEYIIDDCPYLYRVKVIDTASNDVYAQDALVVSGSNSELIEGVGTGGYPNVLKIIDIVEGSSEYTQDTNSLGGGLKYTKISHSEYNKMISEPEYQPFPNEVFYLTDIFGWTVNSISFIPYDRMSGVKYKVSFVMNPDKDEFVYENTSTELAERFSNAFIYRVIDYAVGKIKMELEGE
tara:strand:- start:598 stop:1251 length:654 start_codon:yes stop_codon:yes gene_type:complete